MLQIENIDFSSWPIKEYIEQVLLITPKRKNLPVQLVHYPQSSEMLIFNVGVDGDDGTNAPQHFFCGKNSVNTVYSASLNEPICIVQFKPHAWFAFGKNRPSRYVNKVIRLSCRVGESLHSFIQHVLPDHLLRYLQLEKTKDSAYAKMPGMLRYIDDNLNTVNVMQLGHAFNTSEATLRRYFKKYIGMNVSHYIRNQKIKCMTLRMYQHDYNALAVQECGFYDQSHFIREFKRVHGTTPTQFLSKLKKMFYEDPNAERLFNACYIEG